MIEFSYTLNRKSNNKSDLFIPKDLPKQFDNYVLIEGTNSIGKSTLLNIIAYGLYGYKNNNISEGLISRMKYLCENGRNDISFNLSIMTDKFNGLSCIYANKQLKVHEIIHGNKYIMTSESFERKYKLIYEIPENPTNKFPELIKDVAAMQNIVANRIRIFKIYIDTIEKEINNSQDPKIIKDCEKTINDCVENINKIQDLLNNYQKESEYLEKYIANKYLKIYRDQNDKIESDIQGITNKIKKLPPQNNKVLSEYAKETQKGLDVVRELKEIHGNIGSKFKELNKYKKYFNQWDKMDFKEMLNKSSIPQEDIRFISNIKTSLLCDVNQFENNRGNRQIGMYRELVSVLIKYKDDNYEVPVAHIPISKLINDLKVELRKHDDVVKNNDNMNICVNELIKMKGKIDVLDSIMKKLQKLSGQVQSGTDVSQIIAVYKNQLRIQNEKHDGIKTKYKEYEKRHNICGDLNGNDNYISDELNKLIQTSDEKRQNDYLDELNIKINKYVDNINNYKSKKTIYETKLDLLRDKKPHKYQDKKEIISKIKQQINEIDACFAMKYDVYIGNIRNKIKPKNNDENKFYGLIYAYLANKMGEFYHIDKSYKAKAIDFIDGIIYTDEGESIHFNDMGSGQSQAAYLRTVINSFDERKVIALIDEIEMMDNKSFGIVKDVLCDLKNQNKLVASIIVKKSEIFNVSNIF